MSQPEASKVPLHTFAAYFRDPAAYDPERAWEEALQEVAGEQSAGALHLLAENSLRCCLRTPEAERLMALAEAAVAALQRGERSGSAPFRALRDYLQQLDDACYHLNYSMDNFALRQDILPWTEGLHLQQEMGRHALAVLAAADTPHDDLFAALPEVRRLKELVQETASYPKRIGGQALMPLAQDALQRVAALDAQAEQKNVGRPGRLAIQ